MPLLGWPTVTVPGAVSAWRALSERFGRLSFESLLEPAVRHAREGCPASPTVAAEWSMVAPLYEGMADFAATFLPNGRAPRVGERFTIAGLADTLERLAASEGRDLYEGETARRLVAHSERGGGFLRMDDLAAHEARWTEPIAVDYGRWSLWELPPNGQGLAALIALGVLSHLPVGDHAADSAESIHLQIEAVKIGVADAARYVADPDFEPAPLTRLLDSDYLARRAAQVDLQRARSCGAPAPQHGDTVYLCTADRDGMMVSYIQSNYLAFGSGIVVPGTGVSLHNRGAGFSLEQGHPNRLQPGKRPFHTIIPAFLAYEDTPSMAFGVMGGPMQPQGHVQIAVRLATYGQNPQAAIDAPRWQAVGDCEVAVEAGIADEVRHGLERRGHRVRIEGPTMFGGAQAALCTGDGYVCASDPRKDGYAAGS
jgi:gamma-glutamyltranspeptidase/glutathione hydrolase